MSTFNKGDLVRCINADGWHGITVGNVYEVERDSSEYGVCLVADNRGARNTPMPRRFELFQSEAVYKVLACNPDAQPWEPAYKSIDEAEAALLRDARTDVEFEIYSVARTVHKKVRVQERVGREVQEVK